ncbi:hypothetical protein FVE85_3069 [Porphyridium purpureum]|uniref:Uncharacterized protein n=1 Tax=Porphyridium purpureum TaxID=35688 RepID=A0A5J4YUF9_PORPP|nr:hypothetical protein FVE85_3069 [Porphyridium purpureum]|eukprot:POR5932..scf227_4
MADLDDFFKKKDKKKKKGSSTLRTGELEGAAQEVAASSTTAADVVAPEQQHVAAAWSGQPRGDAAHAGEESGPGAGASAGTPSAAPATSARAGAAPAAPAAGAVTSPSKKEKEKDDGWLDIEDARSAQVHTGGRSVMRLGKGENTQDHESNNAQSGAASDGAFKGWKVDGNGADEGAPEESKFPSLAEAVKTPQGKITVETTQARPKSQRPVPLRSANQFAALAQKIAERKAEEQKEEEERKKRAAAKAAELAAAAAAKAQSAPAAP